MPFLTAIRNKAKKLGKSIVLPEGNDERMIKAAIELVKKGIADIKLLGQVDELKDLIIKNGGDAAKIDLIEPEKADNFEEFVEEYVRIRSEKGKKVTYEDAKSLMKDTLYYGAMMVKKGIVDGSVAGAVHTTADVLRAALRVIGTADGVNTISGSFLMQLPSFNGIKDKVFVFADSAVVPDPTPDQLADIAIASASTYKKIVGDEPKVALLSFSTKGSAKHPAAEKVIKAVNILKERNVNFDFDGELQLDAAIIESVAKRKAPDSSVAGQANVLIFPDLSSGNIGYKLVQRFANAKAIGPIIQGMAKPANDLSRGCSVEDIINVVAIAALNSVEE